MVSLALWKQNKIRILIATIIGAGIGFAMSNAHPETLLLNQIFLPLD